MSGDEGGVDTNLRLLRVATGQPDDPGPRTVYAEVHDGDTLHDGSSDGGAASDGRQSPDPSGPRADDVTLLTGTAPRASGYAQLKDDPESGGAREVEEEEHEQDRELADVDEIGVGGFDRDVPLADVQPLTHVGARSAAAGKGARAQSPQCGYGWCLAVGVYFLIMMCIAVVASVVRPFDGPVGLLDHGLTEVTLRLHANGTSSVRLDSVMGDSYALAGFLLFAFTLVSSMGALLRANMVTPKRGVLWRVRSAEHVLAMTLISAVTALVCGVTEVYGLAMVVLCTGASAVFMWASAETDERAPLVSHVAAVSGFLLAGLPWVAVTVRYTETVMASTAVAEVRLAGLVMTLLVLVLNTTFVFTRTGSRGYDVFSVCARTVMVLMAATAFRR